MARGNKTSRSGLLIAPSRLLKKIGEAQFFLEKMRGSNESPQELGFYLSAFLSALKSIEYLAPLTSRDRQAEIRKGISQLRDNHAALNYLLEARDAEVHREGVGLVLESLTTLKVSKPTFIFPSARFKGRYEGRFQGRFEQPNLGQSQASTVYRPVYRDVWYFENYRREVVETCRDSFHALKTRVTKSVGLQQEIETAAGV